MADETMGFAPGATVEVRQAGDKEWLVLRELAYQAKAATFVVPVGFRTDFASVPRPFVWLLPRYGRYTKAAILHDYLGRVAVPAGELSLADADGIFRQAMRTLDVPFLRRWFMWGAVRLNALRKGEGLLAWLHRSWALVPVAVVALPIVLPAAVVILLTLPVFYLAELVVWLPLLAGQRLRGRPTKKVNMPSLRLKL